MAGVHIPQTAYVGPSVAMAIEMIVVTLISYMTLDNLFDLFDP